MMWIRTTLVVGASCWPSSGITQRATSPREATVFIRVLGEIRVEMEEAWQKSFEKREIELGTGSGFVISPYGHVLTNHHVIRGSELRTEIRGTKIHVQVDVQRVEVVLPAGSESGEGVSERRLAASVDAVDAELDLAVLSVPASEIPYIPFGDSDAVEAGRPVTVLGFPFGRKVEVGKASVPDIVPEVSASRGALAAQRTDDEGRVRYLQTSATMNPGNSGGPLIDENGYAIGVIRMKLADAEGVGFAIPINLVKDFLETHGLDSLLPVRRMRLGEMQSFPEKGLRIRLPEGQEDQAPVRTRLSTSDPVPLVIDRVATPWGLEGLEQALLNDEVFESFSSEQNVRRPATPVGRLAILGNARGTDTVTGEMVAMEYGLFDLGAEKLVVRFLGDQDLVAFNRSVLRQSLASLDIEPLLTVPVKETVSVQWKPTPLPQPEAPSVPFPEAWLKEEASPFPCPELPPPDSTVSASPVGDFTISAIAAWWKKGPNPQQAATSCAIERGRLGATSYVRRTEWLGISYVVEGFYLESNHELIQLEVVAPVEKVPYVRHLLKEWVEEYGLVGGRR